MTLSKHKTLLPAAIASLIIVFSLIAELLVIIGLETSVASAIVAYFGYFTICTNIFVAMCVTSQAVQKQSNFCTFFRRSSVVGCATGSIIIVGFAYHFLLRATANLQGYRFFIDFLLHYVNPVLMLVFWIYYTPPRALQYKQLVHWVVYPLSYLAYILIRGAVIHKYPYAFVNVDVIGYASTLQFAATLTLQFLVVSALLITINRYLVSKR